MKLLVFAHVPPPHHGQSYMVKLMLDGFGGDCRKRGARPAARFGIECYHVNARFSKTLEDIGAFQGVKLLLIFLYCLQAVWCRFRHGAENFYYVPAPGKPVALYRDWLVLLLCRPFFKRIIFHWHAAGLARWLETSANIRVRSFTHRRMHDVDLSLVLSEFNRRDAEKLPSVHIRTVDCGIADPCPDFAETLRPRRAARFAARQKLAAHQPLTPAERQEAGGDPQTVRVLYLAHCMREKGLFAALDGVVSANRLLRQQQSPLRLQLLAAGSFVTGAEREEFDRAWQNPDCADAVELLGFISGAKKINTLRAADLFCFPTRYAAENQPVTLIEAMAFGLPIVTTRWRSLPEMLPPGYPGLVADQNPAAIAAALLALMRRENGDRLREHYLGRFTLERHLRHLADAFHSVE